MTTWRERVLRKMGRVGIGQAELARRLSDAGIPCTRSAVNRWLKAGGKDQRDPSPETLAAICRLLGLSADEVLGIARTDAPAATEPPGELLDAAAALDAARRLLAGYLRSDEGSEERRAAAVSDVLEVLARNASSRQTG